MRFTLTKRKNLALVLAVAVVVVTVLSVLLCASSHQAHCHDEHCPLCMAITIVAKNAKALSLAVIILITMGFSLCVNPFVCVYGTFSPIRKTPFADRVRMNN